MVFTLPLPCQTIIRAYARLDFGQGRVVATPYYKNSLMKKRFTDPAGAGKGAPDEIIAAARAEAIAHRLIIDEMNAADIRSFMIERGIGVDCSGFAARVLNACTHEKFSKPVVHCLQPLEKSFWRRFIFRMRPFQNINVLTLTSPENSVPVALSDIQPGDLVRTRGGKHVLLVESVERDCKEGSFVGAIHELPLRGFTYVHSSGQFGEDSGVREGNVVITEPSKDLSVQEWQEVWKGKVPSRDGWMEEREKNGIFRLKALMQNPNSKDQNEN